jgi:hypothetical protein
MDPTACLDLILSDLVERNREEAIDGLRNLADWLERGGFFPTVKARLEFDHLRNGRGEAK